MPSPRIPFTVALGLAAAFVACSTASPSRSFDTPATEPAPAAEAGSPPSFRTDAAPPEAAPMANPCENDHAPPAGPDAVVATAFAKDYRVFELGNVPGVPGPLGGSVISKDDPNVLLIAGASESEDGGIFAIKILRGPCKHIIGFDGTATKIASTRHVDANLLYTAAGLLLYSRWPEIGIGQLLPGAVQPSFELDLKAFNVGGGGPGGLGFVPPSLPAAGELRGVTWPGGLFYHFDVKPDGQLLAMTDAKTTATLTGGPGGFAYVPAGSPGFPKQSLVVAEWDVDHVAAYEVDDAGDPKVSTRRELLSQFNKPWGAYFEPLTGDFLFLSWGADHGSGGALGDDDRVYVVQGFEPPPPPPTPTPPH